MSELLDLFAHLSQFYQRDILWTKVEELFELEIGSKPNEIPNNNETTEPKRIKPIETFMQLPMVASAQYNYGETLSALKELSTHIRNLRTQPLNSYDNTYDSWDRVAEKSPCDGYLSYIYALAGIALIELNHENLELTLAAVETFFLSLTIPGAKSYSIFQEDIIEHCLRVYDLLEQLHGLPYHTAHKCWMMFLTLCDDLKLVFCYVHFKEHLRTRNAILRRITDILYMNYKNGYTNAFAATMHEKCFEIYDEVANTHNGDVGETLTLLMNYNLTMHSYADRPKCVPGMGSANSNACEHISDWFIKTLAKYPERVCVVLNFYIESVITSPYKAWSKDQLSRALDFAAKYDAAIFTKCNKSSVEFLCKALTAEEVAIRWRTVELIARILQIESQVDWQIFRHEVSDIPRELFLIKELIAQLNDYNNNVRLRAAQALQTALVKGSPNTRKILNECIKNAQFNDPDVKLPEKPRVSKNELRFERPMASTAPAYTFEGYGIIELAVLNLPKCIYKRFLRCAAFNLRKAGISFIETLIKLNPLIIYNTNFVCESMLLANDPIAQVRKQAMISVDALLKTYPNCYAIICVWCRLWGAMIVDTDAKNVALAMECFQQTVLQNIRGIDNTNNPEHFMPWIIIRKLLCSFPRFYLQKSIQMALNDKLINHHMLSLIESHLVASTSTEAWALLNFISGKLKSKEPDVLISHFVSKRYKLHSEAIMNTMLEVLINCVNDFSHSALNTAYEFVLNSIRCGEMMPTHTAKAIDLLNEINLRSLSKSNKAQDSNEWLSALHTELEVLLLNGIPNFPENRYTFKTHLAAYADVTARLPQAVHRDIVKFVQMYLQECNKLPTGEWDPENRRIYNFLLTMLARLSLCDYEHASTTCKLFKQVLRNIDLPDTVTTVIIALTDLGKRHTQIVEDMLQHVLRKLNSPYMQNRRETFKCFRIMILQDQIKMRGTVLLALLAVLVDECYLVAKLADNFFKEYIQTRNATLFHKCLNECPFVLNEYENFVGVDSFQGGNIKSPLKGADKRKERRLLYNHFMASLDEVSLINYFEQLKLIAEKTKNDELMLTPDGIAVVLDVLFIMRRICRLTKEQKTASSDNNDAAASTAQIEDEIEQAEPVPSTSAATAKEQAPTTTGRGRGRRIVKLTVQDALRTMERSLVYIPTIHKNMESVMDDTLTVAFDKLCKALARRFPSYTDYAQPTEFWKKYRRTKTKSTNKRKRKEAETHKNDDDDDSTYEEDSDDDAPLARFKKLGKDAASTLDAICTDYAFNPLSFQ